jgi:cytochrome c biogenesis protein CcmG, thiol:disulfide interchange protein DsbE
MFLRRALLLVGAIGVAVLLLNAISRSERVAIVVGQPLHGVRGELSDGGAFLLDKLRGQVTVLNFWASWCGPCKHEVPALRRIQREGTHVVGLSIEDLPLATVGDKARALGIDYPVGKPEDGLLERLRVEMVPTTCVIDGTGTVRLVESGEASYDELHSAVADASRH